jgi:hypothetical protein
MLELTDDVAATWFLELWTMAPTPIKARHLRKSTVERLLKRYRIRRIDGETVVSNLRQPAMLLYVDADIRTDVRSAASPIGFSPW